MITMYDQHPQPKSNRIVKILGWSAISAVAFFGVCVVGPTFCVGTMARIGENAQRKEQAEKRIAEAKVDRSAVSSFTAEILSRSYHFNEVKADSALKGKYLQITGTVDGIKKNFMDEVYVTLIGKSAFQNVRIEPGPKLAASGWAANLRPRQQVTVVCKVTGMIVGSVMTEDCYLP